MFLKCIRNDRWYDYKTSRDVFPLTINRVYQYLSTLEPFRVLIYCDHNEWQEFPLQLFAPAQQKPLFDWEE